MLPVLDALYFDDPFGGVLSFHDSILKGLVGQDHHNLVRPFHADRTTTILPAYPSTGFKEEAPVSIPILKVCLQRLGSRINRFS